MTSQEHRIRIDLTPEQQNQIKQAAGQDVVAFEFTPDELEQRIVPTSMSPFTFTKYIDKSTP
jgi:type VI protein secretion system component Hcp